MTKRVFKCLWCSARFVSKEARDRHKWKYHHRKAEGR